MKIFGGRDAYYRGTNDDPLQTQEAWDEMSKLTSPVSAALTPESQPDQSVVDGGKRPENAMYPEDQGEALRRRVRDQKLGEAALGSAGETLERDLAPAEDDYTVVSESRVQPGEGYDWDYEQDLNQEDQEEMAHWLGEMQLTDKEFWQAVNHENWLGTGAVVREKLPDFSDLKNKAAVYFYAIAPGLNPEGLSERPGIVTKIAMRRLSGAEAEKRMEMKQPEWHRKHAVAEGLLGAERVYQRAMKDFDAETPAEIADEVYEQVRRAYGKGTLITKGQGDELSPNEMIILHAIDRGTGEDDKQAGGMTVEELAEKLIPKDAPSEVRVQVLQQQLQAAEKRISGLPDENPAKQTLMTAAQNLYEAMIELEAAAIVAANRETPENGSDRMTETQARESMDLTALGLEDKLGNPEYPMDLKEVDQNIKEVERILGDLHKLAVRSEAEVIWLKEQGASVADDRVVSLDLQKARAVEMARQYHSVLQVLQAKKGKSST